MPQAFRVTETTELTVRLVEVLNASRLSNLEKAYALASTLRLLGESFYDREDTSTEAVMADYQGSPSFAGALILLADQVHVIREMFVNE